MVVTREERETIEELAEVCERLSRSLGYVQIALKDLLYQGQPPPIAQLRLVSEVRDAS